MWEVEGNLRFPLDKTYHGCPRNSVIVELKSVEKVLPVHQKQLLTYLLLAEKPLGLLINFNAL